MPWVHFLFKNLLALLSHTVPLLFCFSLISLSPTFYLYFSLSRSLQAELNTEWLHSESCDAECTEPVEQVERPNAAPLALEAAMEAQARAQKNEGPRGPPGAIAMDMTGVALWEPEEVEEPEVRMSNDRVPNPLIAILKSQWTQAPILNALDVNAKIVEFAKIVYSVIFWK